MKKIVSFFLLILFSFNAFSQKKKSTTLGKTSLEEIQLNIYEKDSTAKAVVLYEHANLYLDPENDYKTRVDYYYRIKILSKEGFDKANISINVYKKARAINIKGITYNLSDIGSKHVTKLKEDQIFTVDNTNKWKTKRFSLPNIKVGSVIEYSYSVISPYLGIEDWSFQSDIPKIKSEFDAAVLGNYKYNIRLVGFLHLDKNNPSVKKNCVYIDGLGEGDCAIYSFGMDDIPAFKEEEYMLSKKNFISRLIFDLESYTSPKGVIEKYTNTWRNADKKLKSIFFNNQTSKKYFFKKRLSDSILNNPNNLERAKNVYDFIQKHYTWNSRYWNSNDEKVKNAFNEKTGSAGEINLSLFNALRAANIECNLVILSTRNNGLPTTLYPVIFDFNYVIVKAKIDNNEYFLDATDRFLPFGQVPERCLNGKAREINFKKESNWLIVQPQFISSKKSVAKLTLNENGDISGDLRVTSKGYDAINRRKEINIFNTDDYIDDFENKFIDLEIEKYSVKNHGNLEKPLQELFKLKITSDEQLTKTSRINPFLFERVKINPFKLKERNYPVDYGYARRNNYYLSLEVPNNYKIKSIPKNVAITLPKKGGIYILKAVQKDNIINIYVRMHIRKKTFTASEYDVLKSFYNQIIKSQESSIIFQKLD